MLSVPPAVGGGNREHILIFRYWYKALSVPMCVKFWGHLVNQFHAADYPERYNNTPAAESSRFIKGASHCRGIVIDSESLCSRSY